MLTDALLQLSSAQAVTVSAVSTNTIDLSKARDLGHGKQLYAVFTVDTTATAGGAATVTFQVVSSAAANLGSPTVRIQTDAIAISELTAGRKPIVVPIPPGVLNAQPIGQRYLGANYVVATGPLTAGAFSCTITDTAPTVGANYPSGFDVV